MDHNVVLLHTQSPFSNDQIATIVALREQGLSLSQIAKKTGLSKSTVERRLKSAGGVDPAGHRFPSHPQQPEVVSVPTSSHSAPVTQTETNHRPAGVSIIQDLNETAVNRPFPRPSQAPRRLTDTQSSSSHRSWGDLIRAALLLTPVMALTPWLIATSAEVYIREVGEWWGWWIAVGFEAFFLALAALAPRVGIPTSSPRELWSSFPGVVKSIGWYALLGAMTAYSFHAMTLGVTEGRETALATVAAATATNTELSVLREERVQLINTVTRYENRGWLGEARKLRDDLRTLDSRMDAARERASAAVPAAVSTIEHRTSVGRYLRLCALLINVFCLHLAVRSWSRSRGVHA